MSLESSPAPAAPRARAGGPPALRTGWKSPRADALRRKVAEKQRWAEPLPPEDRGAGFRGWHTRGYLPHRDVPGAQQLITYRLADALPAARRREWAALLEIADPRERAARLERCLDDGLGSCVLRRPEIAAAMVESLRHGQPADYLLHAWVVMPNHVHVLITVLARPLSAILHTWKSCTAKQINRLLGSTGRIWQPDYWDTVIRDEAHFQQAVRYIESNPVRARLAAAPEVWPWSSATGSRPEPAHAASRSAGGPPAQRALDPAAAEHSDSASAPPATFGVLPASSPASAQTRVSAGGPPALRKVMPVPYSA
jgi:REP element-mobilizing transposase RayT